MKAIDKLRKLTSQLKKQQVIPSTAIENMKRTQQAAKEAAKNASKQKA